VEHGFPLRHDQAQARVGDAAVHSSRCGHVQRQRHFDAVEAGSLDAVDEDLRFQFVVAPVGGEDLNLHYRKPRTGSLSSRCIQFCGE
jgi:hypothetical protein